MRNQRSGKDRGAMFLPRQTHPTRRRSRQLQLYLTRPGEVSSIGELSSLREQVQKPKNSKYCFPDPKHKKPGPTLPKASDGCAGRGSQDVILTRKLH